jgi:tetratricopeptide (TPR) repeat protein
VKGEERLWRILNDKLETLRAGNRFPEAIRVGEKALEVARRLFAKNDVSLALSYERLGRLYDQEGSRAEAKPYLVKALQIVERATPLEQRAVYRIARRLALLCDVAKDEQEAIRCYEKAIAAGGQLDDVPHSDLGTLLNNVSLIYRQSGQPDAAEAHYLHALEIYEKQLGPNHSDVAAVLNNLGVFYTNERRFTEAEEMHRRALAIRKQAHPDGHADIAQSNCNLAVVYHSRGDSARAEDLYRESLGAWEKLSKTPPEDYQIVASNYADLLRSLGKMRKAASIVSRARKKRRGV